MYQKYWNLSDLPFLNVTDDRLVYMTDQHQEGLARLVFLVSEGRMAGMLSGPFGIGKSLTLDLLAHHAGKIQLPVIRMDAIPSGTLPMARYLLRLIGIEEIPQTLPDALMLLQIYCQNASNPVRRLLLIDEAHYLAVDDGYYFAHYLCNLRISGKSGRQEQPLFTLVLAGTEKLRQTVNEYESLRRRIQLDWVLAPLNQKQSLEYVQFRIRGVSGDMWIFSEEALTEIFRWSAGIPRNINHLCDTALMLGYAAQVSQISGEIIRQAAVDTGLDQSQAVTDALKETKS
ncbi:MAG: AAA family ATPase [bacterium]